MTDSCRVRLTGTRCIINSSLLISHINKLPSGDGGQGLGPPVVVPPQGGDRDVHSPGQAQAVSGVHGVQRGHHGRVPLVRVEEVVLLCVS